MKLWLSSRIWRLRDSLSAAFAGDVERTRHWEILRQVVRSVSDVLLCGVGVWLFVGCVSKVFIELRATFTLTLSGYLVCLMGCIPLMVLGFLRSRYPNHCGGLLVIPLGLIVRRKMFGRLDWATQQARLQAQLGSRYTSYDVFGQLWSTDVFWGPVLSWAVDEHRRGPDMAAALKASMPETVQPERIRSRL